MADQAEEIRRRLEARASGQPFVPPSVPPVSAPGPVHAPPSPAPALRPETAARVRQRKMEAAIADTSNAQPVIVVDVQIKFFSMMVLLVKMSIAAIPAMIITILFWIVFFWALGGWGQLLRTIFSRHS